MIAQQLTRTIALSLGAALCALACAGTDGTDVYAEEEFGQARQAMETIYIEGEAPPRTFPEGSIPFGHGLNNTTRPSGGGGAQDSGGGGRDRSDDSTLGRGPNFTDLRDSPGWTCETGRSTYEKECRSCLDTNAGWNCICHTCEPATNSCTEFYDCTVKYRDLEP